MNTVQLQNAKKKKRISQRLAVSVKKKKIKIALGKFFS